MNKQDVSSSQKLRLKHVILEIKKIRRDMEAAMERLGEVKEFTERELGNG